ncbi:hypothetical protein [Brevibacterium ravenspurgense]|uniref:hypothetical protein n=1 Tax=Brevibacterium ravenspurgense TaxID=479117 RepID=UPI0003667523|nr:hypothetical protein [Brevibacterium ravenspurgense]
MEQKKSKLPLALKHEVVDRFIAGETARELAREYELGGPDVVLRWARHQRKRGRVREQNESDSGTEQDQLRREYEKLQAENAYLRKLIELKAQGRF